MSDSESASEAAAGIEDGQTSPDPVVLDWVVEDANPTTVDALLDGAAVVSPVTVDALGEHVLEVFAVDCADNEAMVMVIFTIERQGPPPVVGDLTVVPDIVERGQLVTLTAVITNEGGDGVTDMLVELVIVPEAGGDPVAEFASMISLGPEEARTVVHALRTHGLAPGLYRAELVVSGTFFGEDYELRMDQAAFEVLQIVAIPDVSPLGILMLILMIAVCGMWRVRRSG